LALCRDQKVLLVRKEIKVIPEIKVSWGYRALMEKMALRVYKDRLEQTEKMALRGSRVCLEKMAP
jgi:hypothetical protein